MKNKILKPEQNITGSSHFSSSVKRAENALPSQQIVAPWSDLPKDIALAHMVKSFKSKLDLYLNKVGGNTRLLVMAC